MTSLTKGGIKSEMYSGISPFTALYMNANFCSLRLILKGTHPHSLYKLSKATERVKPVTILAASFCNLSRVLESWTVQLSHTIDEYSNIDKT